MMRVLLFLFLALFLTAFAAAAPRTHFVPSGYKMDEVGKALRAGLDQYYTSQRAPYPSDWEILELQLGSAHVFNNGTVLAVIAKEGEQTRLTFLGDGETSFQAALPLGEKRQFGPIELIVIDNATSVVRLVVRGSGEATPKEKVSSRDRVTITGFEDPDRFRVSSDDAQAMGYVEGFFSTLRQKVRLEDAHQAALEEMEQTSQLLAASPSKPAVRDYSDPVNFFFGEEQALPHTAMVTLELSQGAAGRQDSFSSSGSYNSGAPSGDTGVSIGSDGRGGRLRISDGSRWGVDIDAQTSTMLRTNGHSAMVRVPLNGNAFFSFQGPNGLMRGRIEAQPRGRDAIQLRIRSTGGDWSAVGSVSTTVIVREGQRLKVAGSSGSTSTSFSSSAPIIGGIPYVGALAGSESRSQSGSNYSLYVSARLE